MRSRILLSIVTLFAVVATTLTMLAACSGRSTNPPEIAGESSTAAPPVSAGRITRPARGTDGSDPPSKPGPNPPRAPKPNASPVRFGPVTASGAYGAVTSVSPDRRTMTTTFSALEVSLDESTRPDATRRFTLALPMTGADQKAKVRFYASGYAFTQSATARLTFRVNGRTHVSEFGPGWDDDFDRTLDLPAIPATTYQLSVVLEVHIVPGADDSKAVYLNIKSLDAEIT
jgi:hypothetical protein